MTTISPITAVGYLRLAGFTGGTVAVMTAIAGAESTFQTDVTHHNGDGSTDYGLFQINSKNTAYADGPDFFPPGEGWKSGYRNAVVAKKIYDAQGLRAWTTYSNGDYVKFLGDAQTAASTSLTSQAQSELQKNLTQAGVGAQVALNALGLPVTPTLNIDGSGNLSTDWGSAVGNPLGSIFSAIGPALWIGGGALLVLLGIMLYAKGDIASVAKVVAK